MVSAVNLRKGGTLTILRQCLEYLSGRVSGAPLPPSGWDSVFEQPPHCQPKETDNGDLRVIALVHKKELCCYPGIEYIEMPWCIRSWTHRLWAEYVTMHRISKEIEAADGRKIWLWLSLHDTSPRVEAEHRKVYCHTSFPFLKVRARDWYMDPKIPLFANFTKWAYRINIRKNDSIIVQQNWFADSLSSLVRVPRDRFLVIPPATPGLKSASVENFSVESLQVESVGVHLPGLGSASADRTPTDSTCKETNTEKKYRFLYVSTPDCHKNFETLCEAARQLEQEGLGFTLTLTVKGDENRYARWLKKRWGNVESIDFHGLMGKEELQREYARADCFVFPSRIETWGLPISEYLAAHPGGKLILANLPYAHETSKGADARYFAPDDIHTLKELMNESFAAW